MMGRIFPEQWKVQKLLCISKGTSQVDDNSKLRPLCMIKSTVKIFERIFFNTAGWKCNILYYDNTGGRQQYNVVVGVSLDMF